jgi:hypothetical protein
MQGGRESGIESAQPRGKFTIGSKIGFGHGWTRPPIAASPDRFHDRHNVVMIS